MATSNSYQFNPSLGSLTLAAYDLCGVRRSAILQEHLEAARIHSNFLLGRFSSQGVNTWAVDLVTVPLVQGTSTYNVDPSTIVMLDAYITAANGGATFDRIIMPISRTEYASYPQKDMQGWPTVFWMDRLLSPTVTIWPVPDGNQTSLKYYRLRQIQDAALQNGLNVEIPYYWLEAFTFALAARLALIYAPDKAAGLKMLADESYGIAAAQNVETSNYYISPVVAPYWRP